MGPCARGLEAKFVLVPRFSQQRGFRHNFSSILVIFLWSNSLGLLRWIEFNFLGVSGIFARFRNRSHLLANDFLCFSNFLERVFCVFGLLGLLFKVIPVITGIFPLLDSRAPERNPNFYNF